MTSLATALATAALLIPAERHIDFSGWPGKALPANIEFDVRITSVDGTSYETTVKLSPDATATHARDLLWFALKRNGWRGEAIGKDTIMLVGSEKSRVRSVEFKSKDWTPDVRVVPLVPPDKK